MPNHDTAIKSVQGLVAIVAGLGISNTLDQLIKSKPDTIRKLTSLVSCPELCAIRNLALDSRLIPIIMAILQIAIALRFYQATTINLEDRHPTLPANASPQAQQEARRYFFAHIIVVIIEGIVVAGASFYIQYPPDFVLLSLQRRL
jgi:hypothetical protein